MNRSDFTTDRSLIELKIAEAMGKISTPTRGEIREFTAVALTDAIPLSKTQLDEYGKSEYGKSTPTAAATAHAISRFTLKAMIIGDVNGDQLPFEENPHRFLPNACNLGSASDVNEALRLIVLYPLYISARDFELGDANEMSIKRNDRIKVSMVLDENNNIVPDSGEIMELIERAENNETLQNFCQDLEGAFVANANAVTLLGDVAAVSDMSRLDPTFRAQIQTLFDQLRDLGYKPEPHETWRSQARQAWLYASGRTRPGPIVTNAPAGAPSLTGHGSGKAIDIIDGRPHPTRSGFKIAWGSWPGPGLTKREGDETANQMGAQFFEDLGRLAKAAGLTWGGDWTLADGGNDRPHVEAKR